MRSVIRDYSIFLKKMHKNVKIDQKYCKLFENVKLIIHFFETSIFENIFKKWFDFIRLFRTIQKRCFFAYNILFKMIKLFKNVKKKIQKNLKIDQKCQKCQKRFIFLIMIKIFCKSCNLLKINSFKSKY